MRIKTIPLVGCLLVAPAVFGVLAANGGDSGNGTTDQCPFGIIEGPDPIGLSDCFGDPAEKSATGDKKISKTDPNLPPGPARSMNGRPDFGFDPKSGQPFMVWADGNARDHDIAFTMWVDSEWGRVEYLTSSLADDLDPRAFAAADGSIHVSWWTDGIVPQIYFSRRDPSAEGWTDGRPVARNGSRPTIAVVDGRVWVAFERPSKFGLRLVIVASELSNGEFVERVVATSDDKQPLDVELHMDAGHLWLDWKQSRREFGFSEWIDGRWSGVATEPWSDHSWAGQRQVRRRIRDLVLTR